jgi:surface polysaccharide O-acyltransferase-like enzyme
VRAETRGLPSTAVVVRDSPPPDAGASEVRPEPTGWLDLARVLAITAVVMVHEAGAAVGSRSAGEPATPAWWAADLLDAASRWCVPVFLMVSGALLLDPARTGSTRAFYRRRLARIGPPLVVWTVVYLLFRHLYLDVPMGVRDAARAVASGAPFLHLYFLYVLAGLYLLTPFLRAALRSMNHRTQVGFAAVLLGLGAVDQVLMTFLHIGEPNAATRYVPYLGYFVAGWVLRNQPPRPGITRFAVVALPACVALTALAGGVAAADGRGWGPDGEYAFSYLSPNVAIMSAAAFWLLRAFGTRAGDRWCPGRWTARAGRLTFGIFLVHALLWYPLIKDWQVPAGLAPYLATAAWHWLLVLTGSTLLTAVLRRLPLLRRLV